MIINIMDRDFNTLGQIDEFDSFIGDKSYHGVAGFELHLSYKANQSDRLIKKNIIYIDEKRAYIILYRKLDTQDNSLIVKGLELKSYLKRWLVFPPTNESHLKIKGPVETVMKTFVDSTLQRKGITEIVVSLDQGRGEVMTYQSRYKNLAEELEKISKASGIGWNIELDLKNKKFVFEIIVGKDRSINQSEYPPIVFSQEYDNIENQTFVESLMDYSNAAVIAGQGEGVDRVIKIIEDTSGFDSFEMFVDARDIENVEELPERGKQKLAEVEEVISFDSKVLTDQNFIYEKDYNMGDIVTNESLEWGLKIDRRIVGISETYEEDGFNLDVLFGENIKGIKDRIQDINRNIEELRR